MNLKEFQLAMIDYLKGQFDDDIEISPVSVLKNNSTVLEGVSFKRKGTCLQPTVYINDAFSEYEETGDFEKECRRILENIKEADEPDVPDLSFLYDYESMKDRIVCKVISKKKNEKFLKDVPHKTFLDLAVVFYFMIDFKGRGTGTVLLRNCHIASWNVTVNDMYKQAVKNNNKLLGNYMSPIENVLEDILARIKGTESGDFISPSDPALLNPRIPMYVLTNEKGLNGAACILDRSLLKRLSRTVGKAFYILPSSIHELIILPTDECDCAGDLRDIVRSVNNTQLSAEDVLSDEVYFYDSDVNKVVIA